MIVLVVVRVVRDVIAVITVIVDRYASPRLCVRRRMPRMVVVVVVVAGIVCAHGGCVIVARGARLHPNRSKAEAQEANHKGPVHPDCTRSAPASLHCALVVVI
ncbi:MAG: hypothetical protein NVS3B20_16840 [Polyangiales bacterium]